MRGKESSEGIHMIDAEGSKPGGDVIASWDIQTKHAWKQDGIKQLVRHVTEVMTMYGQHVMGDSQGLSGGGSSKLQMRWA